MKRLRLMLAVCAGVAAIGPSAASAAPPPAPPGCATVLTTPAVTTGADQGLAAKEAAYTRVCLS
jgi:ABC-type glycerol-3-phosphate transport system substrate-binding protein